MKMDVTIVFRSRTFEHTSASIFSLVCAARRKTSHLPNDRTESLAPSKTFNYIIYPPSFGVDGRRSSGRSRPREVKNRATVGTKRTLFAVLFGSNKAKIDGNEHREVCWGGYLLLSHLKLISIDRHGREKGRKHTKHVIKLITGELVKMTSFSGLP